MEHMQRCSFFFFWHLSNITGVPTMNYAASLRSGKDIINVRKIQRKKVGRVQRKMVGCVAHLMQVFD